MAEATLDPERVAGQLDRLLRPVDEQGMRLVARLNQLGRVGMADRNTVNRRSVGITDVVAKEPYLLSSAWPLSSAPTYSVADEEAVAILSLGLQHA